MSEIELIDTITTMRNIIRRNTQKLRTLKELSVGTTLAYGGERVQTSRSGGRLESVAVKIVDLEETIKRDEELLRTLTNKLFDKLSRLDNDKYITVLWKKYGEGKNNSVIADELNYSTRYIRQLQDEAFRLFTKSL